MKQGNLPPAKQYPDEIHHNGYTARLIGTVHQLMAERPEGEGTELEELYAKRNADDGDAHQQPYDIVDNGDDDTAKNQPEYIADRVHSAKQILPGLLIQTIPKQP